MLNKKDYDRLKAASMAYFEKAGIVINEQEKAAFQVAEYNLGCVDEIGLELIEYVNTDRCCAKELVLLPGQTCPEHRHPPVCGEIGKEETFRCRYGTVYLYVPGEPVEHLQATLPKNRAQYFTCRHEIVLHPGEQYAGASLPLLERFQNPPAVLVAQGLKDGRRGRIMFFHLIISHRY